MRLGHLATADNRQALRLQRREGIDRHRRRRRSAGGGQFAGIAQQQRLTGLHRHQQRPGRHQWTLLAHDVRRGLDPVNAVFSQHTQIVDEVASALGKLHQLLRRLHRLPGGQVAEQFA
ncbi:hypothetical protein D3C87_1693490 [compost metagenome]